MDIQLLNRRHSVRSFSSLPLKNEDVVAIKSEISYINSHFCGLHFQLFTEDEAPFKGFTRSYGFFKGVRNYVACISDSSYEMYEERCGFAGEQLVMSMVKRGIGTCFVSGTFSSSYVNAQMRAGWKLLFLIAIGYEEDENSGMLKKISKKVILGTKKNPEDFYDSSSLISIKKGKEFFPKLELALEACACAPSARNSQPVKISVVPALPDDDNPFAAYGMIEDDKENYTLRARVESSSNLIDLGIAMYNISSVIGGEWIFGNPAILGNID